MKDSVKHWLRLLATLSSYTYKKFKVKSSF